MLSTFRACVGGLTSVFTGSQLNTFVTVTVVGDVVTGTGLAGLMLVPQVGVVRGGQMFGGGGGFSVTGQ